MTASDDTRARTIARIGELVSKTETIADPAARHAAVDLTQAVMELHAAALSRAMEIVAASGGDRTLDALAADDLVATVLVLHGLHPDDTETRLRRAFDKLRAFFDVRGAGLSLISVDSTGVHVRFQGARPGDGTAARQVIEDTFYEAAPEIERLTIDGLEERRENGFVPLTDLLVQKV
jgi:hypothetical protein